MVPFKSLITVDPSNRMAQFLQVAEQLRRLIGEGLLLPGQKLPGTRQLAGLLELHRKTIVAAYDELLAQGWLTTQAGSGTYVANPLPHVRPQSFQISSDQNDSVRRDPVWRDPVRRDPVRQEGVEPGYSFDRPMHLARPLLFSGSNLRLDDGFPDIRLAPMIDLTLAYRHYFRWGNPQQHFGYGDPKGHPLLRQELSIYLNETRALQTTPDQILITRGSIMGLYLTSTLLIQRGQTAVVGETNWAGANMNFRQAGAEVLTVPVDQHGLDVDALATLCRRRAVRLVYVTPHHHYPTTVTMPPDRRLQLLQLSQQYGFAILEDDYDYEFHYLRRPILPLASADRDGMVIYVGSLSKSVAPAFRIGYVVAPTVVVDEMARIRRIIDRQGDAMLEFAVSQLFRNGELRRHLKRALQTYAARRDYFCQLLTTELADRVQFSRPDGGLAVWTQFDPAVDLGRLVERAEREGLSFANGKMHDPPGKSLNSTRLGFASSTEPELAQSVAILRRLLAT